MKKENNEEILNLGRRLGNTTELDKVAMKILKENQEEICECGHNSLVHSELQGCHTNKCDCKQFKPKSQNHILQMSVPSVKKLTDSVDVQGEKVGGARTKFPSETLKDKIEEIAMLEAEKRENEILENFNLKSLTKEQIKRVAELLSHSNKLIIQSKEEKFKEAINRLKERLDYHVDCGTIWKEIDEIMGDFEK